MSRSKKKKVEYYVFENCEVCGTNPAIIRFWNGKTLCTECAARSFKKYLVTLVAGAAILVIGLLVIG